MRDPRFRESDAVAAPVTVGLLRPVVLLPMDWREWPGWKLDAVVEHELAHARRGDCLVTVCAALNRCIFWFHPLAWWLEKRLAALAEQASDDWSMAAVADRARYAQALLEIAASLGRSGRRAAWQGVAMARSPLVSRRIERILDLRENPGGILSQRAWLALFACALPVFYAAGAVMLQAVEYTGKLKPELAAAPWRQVDGPMLPATRDERAALPQPVGDADEVFLGRLTGWMEKGGVRLALVRPKGAPEYLYADTNFNGILEPAERHEFGGDHETTIYLPLARGPVRRYPMRIRILESEGMPAPAWSPFAFAEGAVNVAGRDTLVWYQFDFRSESVHPDYGWEGMDTNGDGKIDTHPVRSPEFAFARDEMVVFRVGDHYVSTKSVDLATGRIVLRALPASGYERIELQAGNTLPDFEFMDFAGRAHRFSEFRGKYVLLDFWGIWCGPCLRELPFLRRAYEQFRSRGFEILGLDDDEDLEKPKHIVAREGVTWLQADARKLIQKRFRVSAYPTAVLVDPRGRILSMGEGESLRGENLIPTLDRLLPR